MGENLKTFKVIIEYDGSSYKGWQKQNNVITLQKEIEDALKIIFKCNVIINGSGRTDSGVHAFGQVATFKVFTSLNNFSLYKNLNSILKKNIVIKRCTSVSNNFHARYNAKLKVYRYYIINRLQPISIGKNFIWNIKKNLNLNAMQMACNYFKGKQNFSTFESKNKYRKNSVRNITKSYIVFDINGRITYTIEGNGFLRFMVRNIVGSIVKVGLGEIKQKEIIEKLQNKSKKTFSFTAPSSGLVLLKVIY